MNIVRTIIQLLQRCVSQRKIAKELNVHRDTVRNYISKCRESPHSLDELLSLDDATLSEIIYPGAAEDPPQTQSDPRRHAFDAKRDYYVKEMNRRPPVSKTTLWEEYRKEHEDGYGYSQFCELLRRYQKISKMEYQPGDLMMIDFAGDKLHYTDRETGEVYACPVLVCVLPYSGYSFVKALPNATLPHLVKALNECLQFFGGAPLRLRCDNMRQMVTKACKYEPMVNDLARDWGLHYNMHLETSRVRKPRDKAHVENEVKIVYDRIFAPLRDMVFHSLEELNRAIMQQLKRHHKKLFQRKDHSRADLFTSSEQPTLRDLPKEPFVMKWNTESKVPRNYHVILGQDYHHYSVPYHLVG